jgi:AAA+ superfamily predicted ATPase
VNLPYPWQYSEAVVGNKISILAIILPFPKKLPMNTHQHFTSMLTVIQETVCITEEKAFNEEFIYNAEPVVEPLAAFFNISHAEAILLAFFLRNQLKDIESSKECIMGHFGKALSGLAIIDQHIKSLAAKRFIMLQGVDQRFRLSYQSVLVNPRLIHCLSEGKLDLLQPQRVDKFSDMLLDINDLIAQRISGNISTSKLLEEGKEILHLNSHLPETKWLLAQPELSATDLMVLLHVCIQYNKGEESVELDKVVKDVFDNNSEALHYRMGIKEAKCQLFKGKYIQDYSGLFDFCHSVELCDRVKEKLFTFAIALKPNSFEPEMGKLVSPSNIPDEDLVYNSREQEQIELLSKALTAERFTAITVQMAAINMRPGFTVLLYGQPGTGKTASVKQLARQTSRHILMVDIPQINSKWVGESEKNIAKVFEEYREAKKQFERSPILLFNEADAIFGKRVEVQNSVDKMRNAMQNILLQELEDFEGIFMATTNLAGQLDSAFERRLLYKVEFKQPEWKVRLAIMQKAFPEMGLEFLQGLTAKFPLTGGQIANIRKKILVSSLLENTQNLTVRLEKCCEEEFALSKSNRNPIGFNPNI